MTSSYLRRLEALEESRSSVCERGCVRCLLAGIARPTAEGAACDLRPMDLIEILAGMRDRKVADLDL